MSGQGGDLYHGEYPVDMTQDEAKAEIERLSGAQRLLRDPDPHEEIVAKAHEYVRKGDYRMAYFKMCEAYGKLRSASDAPKAGGDAVLRERLEAALADPRDRRSSRNYLGELVREVWMKWAAEQPNCKPSWTVPYRDLSEPDKEVDRRIGAALANAGIQAWLAHNRFLFRDLAAALTPHEPGEREAR